MTATMRIGKIAEDTGVKVPTIRYYEQIGLLSAPSRSKGGRRLYSDEDQRRLSFIRHSRKLGFDIEEIRTLLSLQDNPENSCQQADHIAKLHLAEVRTKIASLTALQRELERMVEGCLHGRVETCQVIEILSDHGKCRFHVDA